MPTPAYETAVKAYNAQLVVLPGSPKKVQLWNIDGPVGTEHPINALPPLLYEALSESLNDDAAVIAELQGEIGQA